MLPNVVIQDDRSKAEKVVHVNRLKPFNSSELPPITEEPIQENNKSTHAYNLRPRVTKPTV